MKSFNGDKKKELLKVKLSEIIRKEADHPALSFMTIADLIIDRKLQKLDVVFSCFGADPNVVQAELNRLASRLRNRLFLAAEMKHIPPLTFRYNKGADHAEKMDKVFARLSAAAPAETDTGSDG